MAASEDDQRRGLEEACEVWVMVESAGSDLALGHVSNDCYLVPVDTGHTRDNTIPKVIKGG